MAFYPREVGEETKELKSEGWEVFQKDKFVWTKIAKHLEREKDIWSRYATYRTPNIEAELVRHHLAASYACKALALDFDQVQALIHAYAERNASAHSSLETLIEERRWADLARTLREDLDNLRR
ncbi:MAG: hypothetical protein Q9228_007210, partial [Teloschistes exilis]